MITKDEAEVLRRVITEGGNGAELLTRAYAGYSNKTPQEAYEIRTEAAAKLNEFINTITEKE